MIYLTKGVALLHFGRAGSTLISTLIAQNKLFYDDGEVFEKVRTGNIELKENDPIGMKQILKQRRKRFFYRDYLVSIKPIVEEHLRPDLLDVSYEDFLKILKDAGINKYIIVKRKNYFKQLFSGKLALEWKKYHFTKHEKPSEIKVHIDVNNFSFGTFKGGLIELFKKFDNYYKIMEKFTPKALVLVYEEDIENDPYVAYDKVKTYLNLNKKRPNIILSKSNIFKNEDVIENYDDVMTYLKGTPYEWMVMT